MVESRDAISLRNIRELGVVIEGFPVELGLRMLYQRRLRAEVEARLARAGIEVLPEEEAISKGLPYLYMNINLVKTDVGLYAFATRVCLKQTMLLPRQPSVELYTSTWEIGGVGTVGVNNPSSMLGSVMQHLDQFCEDHLAENLDVYGAPRWIQCLADKQGRFKNECQDHDFTEQLSNG